MKIVSLVELRLSESDIRELGDDVFSVFATLSYAANEINLFMKLFLQSEPVTPQDSIAKKKAALQKLIITRAMNAKVFEAFSMLEKSQKLLSRAVTTKDDNDILGVFEGLNEIKESDGYRIAKILRDDMTNHYQPSITRNNLHRARGGLDQTIYLHDMMGDSFYPFGEDFVFGIAITKIAYDKGNSTEEVLAAWMDWCLTASRRLSKALEDISILLVVHRLEKTGRQTKPYVEPELVRELKEPKLPLFCLPISDKRS